MIWPIRSRRLQVEKGRSQDLEPIQPATSIPGSNCEGGAAAVFATRRIARKTSWCDLG